MKFFVCFALIVAVAAANPTGSATANTNQEAEGKEVQSGVAPATTSGAVDLTRLRKAAYGGSAGGYGASSIPAPPCPKNYLFSCQPSLSPVPCSAPSASYGSAGAYSAPVPTYVAVRGNYGVPQTYGVPQGLGYNTQKFYQY